MNKWRSIASYVQLKYYLKINVEIKLLEFVKNENIQGFGRLNSLKSFLIRKHTPANSDGKW